MDVHWTVHWIIHNVNWTVHWAVHWIYNRLYTRYIGCTLLYTGLYTMYLCFICAPDVYWSTYGTVKKLKQAPAFLLFFSWGLGRHSQFSMSRCQKIERSTCLHFITSKVSLILNYIMYSSKRCEYKNIYLSPEKSVCGSNSNM